MDTHPETLKVLHILNELRPSGAEEMLRVAGPYWKSLGCELHIVCIAKIPGDFAPCLEKAGWSIQTTGCTGRALTLWPRLWALIRDIHPDILHIHPEGYGSLPAMVGWSLGLPMARTVHNSFGFTGLLRLRKTLERWFARKLGVNFIAISESVHQNESDRFHNPCVLLWNWIDTERFRPPSPEERAKARRERGISADRTVLLSVGNASDVKNYRVIIEALPMLNEPGLLYCQVGHPHLEHTDQNLVDELRLQSQVRFCGPSREVLQWLWAADIFVMPSIYEGFGLAAVEALATGCRCIFADCPGLRDFKAFHLPVEWCQTSAQSVSDAVQSVLSQCQLDNTTAPVVLEVRQLFSSNLRAKKYFTLWASLAACRT